MVAEEILLKPAPEPPQAPKRSRYWLLLIAGLFILFGLPKWKDVVRENDSGEYKLQEWREDERIVELDRNENAEQYRLLARSAGYYPCFLCPEKKIWLNMGETAKIGITTNRSVRYNDTWLINQNVLYVTDVTGDLATVRRVEINKIADYPLWLENVTRPEAERLVVPPFHKTIRLK